MAGKQFIGHHGRDIGLRETLEIATFFIDSRKPQIRVAVNDAIVPKDAVALL